MIASPFVSVISIDMPTIIWFHILYKINIFRYEPSKCNDP